MAAARALAVAVAMQIALAPAAAQERPEAADRAPAENKLACDGGDLAACEALARAYRDHFRRACDLGLPFGCLALARAYQEGRGVRGVAGALLLLGAACGGSEKPPAPRAPARSAPSRSRGSQRRRW